MRSVLLKRSPLPLVLPMSIISQDSSANTPESPRGSTERPIKVKPERSRCSIPISPGSTGNFYAGKKYSNDRGNFKSHSKNGKDAPGFTFYASLMTDSMLTNLLCIPKDMGRYMFHPAAASQRDKTYSNNVRNNY